MADIDIVVVSYNSRDHLRACVAPLSAMPGVRVIVADSASSDGSLEVVDDLPIVRLPLPENRGFAFACNEAIKASASPYVLLLNPDARLDEEAIDVLRDALECDPSRGAVGPKILDEDGVLQHSIRRNPRVRSAYAQAMFLHRIWPKASWTDELVRDPAAYLHAHPVDWISGACIMLRRTALEAVSGLDAGFFLYREDADLCRRITQAGYRVWFDPRATCFHVGGASHPREALFGILAQSRIRYAEKHGGIAAAQLERAAVILRGATHAVFGAGGLAMRKGHLQALRIGLSGSARRQVRPGGPR